MKRISIALLALTLAVFLAVPAVAEVEPYASMRLLTGYYDVDPNQINVDDDTDLIFALSNISRFGAKFKTGDISGHVEFGMTGAESGNNTYDRLLYGTWDFGGGSLMVGQNYPPYTFISAQTAPHLDLGGDPGDYEAENTNVGYGALWEARKPQIKLTLANGFYVALIEPEKMSNADVVARTGFLDGDVDTTVPKVCVGYKFKTESLMLNPGVAYNTMDLESKTANWDEDVTSYLIYLNGKVALEMMDIQGSIHYGENLTDFGLWNREDAASAQFLPSGVEDSTSYGGYLQISFKVDPATISLGYGYTQSETDLPAPNNETDEQQTYFVNAKIPIADTFFIVPEVTFYDQMEDDADQDEAEAWWIGLKWQMDF